MAEQLPTQDLGDPKPGQNHYHGKTNTAVNEHGTRLDAIEAGGGGGGGSGVTDHSALTGRDAVGQHPTSAVTGLDAALTAKADLVGGLVSTSQIPPLSITDTFTVATQAAMLALTAQRGDVAVRTDSSTTWILVAEPASTLANWKQLATPTDLVLSVAGRQGAVVLAKGDVGLANVDNTADASKPVSTAQATAIGAKADDTAVVHKTGSETVAGVKTFSDIPAVPDASFGVAKLAGTGTRDTTTFLRGDGTFAAPAGGGGGGGPVVAIGTRPAWGAITETIPGYTVTGSGTTLISGQVTLVRVAFAAGDVVTSISFVSGSTAAGTPTNQWFVLTDLAGNVLRYTVDDTTTPWVVNTVKTLALTTAFTIPTTGIYRMGIMVAATTVPASRSALQATADGVTQAAIAHQSTNTGLTSPPFSTLPASSTSNARVPFGYAQ